MATDLIINRLINLSFFYNLSGSEDLNSFEDENLVRSLTEFGENYERWFKTDDGILKGN